MCGLRLAAVHYIPGHHLLDEPGVFADKQAAVLINIYGLAFNMLVLAINFDAPRQSEAKNSPFINYRLGPFIIQKRIVIFYPAQKFLQEKYAVYWLAALFF